MRCKICNSLLTEYEISRKDPSTGEFLDTCGDCIGSIREALQDFDDTPYRYDILHDDNEFEENDAEGVDIEDNP